MFKMASAGSTHILTEVAIDLCLDEVLAELKAMPDYVMVHASVAYDETVIRSTLAKRLPGVMVHGASSCAGALAPQGVMQEDGRGMALMAIVDEDGDYGTGCAALIDRAEQAAVIALEAAMERADRPGQIPDLLWVSSSPGQEEAVIAGLQELVGPETIIVGGSSADNDISGQWWIMDHMHSYGSGVVVSALYPSVTVGTAFQCTYDPSEKQGLVTKAEGRTLYEINGRPARDVYNEWTAGVLAECPTMEPSNILGLTSLSPLGRRLSAVGGIDFHLLSHPETVQPDGSLTLFTEVQVGDEFVQMAGNEDMLVTRAAKVVQSAKTIAEVETADISGAIVVYCAGCMLTVQDRVPEIHRGLADAIGGAPFIGTFTFGEQGRLITEENRHGNLMVSAVVFGGA